MVAQLVAVSPMTPDNSLGFTEKAGLTYEVLSEVGFHVVLGVNLGKS